LATTCDRRGLKGGFHDNCLGILSQALKSELRNILEQTRKLKSKPIDPEDIIFSTATGLYFRETTAPAKTLGVEREGLEQTLDTETIRA
jgi:hypothetical protein